MAQADPICGLLRSVAVRTLAATQRIGKPGDRLGRRNKAVMGDGAEFD